MPNENCDYEYRVFKGLQKCSLPKHPNSTFCFWHTRGLDRTSPRIKIELEQFIREQASLEGFSLRGADLRNFNFQSPQIEDTNPPITDLSLVDLSDANLAGANFRDTYLLGAEFRRARLIKAVFDRASAVGVDFREADLTDATLDGCDFGWESKFEGALLQGTSFRGATRLNRMSFGKFVGEERKRWFHIAEEIYSSLRNYFRDCGQHEDERWAVYRTTDMARRSHLWFHICHWPRQSIENSRWDRFLTSSERNRVLRVLIAIGLYSLHFPRYLGLSLLKLICGYGERPFRTIATGAVVMLGSALIYFATGAITTHPISNRPLPDEKVGLADALYFSIVTFTTVGFGDWHPKPDSWVRYWVVGEALTGVFISSLFVVTFARKVMR